MDNFAEGYAMGRDSGNNNGFGNGWEGLIGLALVAGLFDGGFGIGGNRGNRGGNCATTEDVRSAVDQQTLISKIDQQTYGLADTFNALNNTLNSNFRGVDNAICTLGYNQAQLTNQLSTQLANCCCNLGQQIADFSCATNRNIDAVRYENAKNTCDIIRAGQDNTRAILDYLTSEKISSLQAENSGLKAQISNDMQTRQIVGALTPKCPEPAYIVPNPNCCYDYTVTRNGCCGF
jgi:hypothetical protein